MLETNPAGEPTKASRETPTKPASSATDITHAFRSYFAQRAAANVMVGKAVTHVSFANGVVLVTFDPEAAGVSPRTFDDLKGFDNLARFAATPIAFNDEIGNMFRPEIDTIETVRTDGTPLGSLNRLEILAINGLSE